MKFFTEYTGYPYGLMCCTNNVYLWTKSTAQSSTKIYQWSCQQWHCNGNM